VRIIIAKGALASALRLGQWVLGAAAVLMLGYCGFALVDARIFQNREGRLLDQLMHDRSAPNGGTLSIVSLTAEHGLIGRIDIPRIGISAIVIEGTGSATLRRAVGHIPGTALPGGPGNIGVSAHRDTFFRPLRNIQRNDIITFTTLLGEYRYRVVSTKIVGPDDVAVLDPAGNEILTLVTCYPFYFVGSAPNRFIVRAERVI
jgi:sortase A